jgi:hypothetical protein
MNHQIFKFNHHRNLLRLRQLHLGLNLIMLTLRDIKFVSIGQFPVLDYSEYVWVKLDRLIGYINLAGAHLLINLDLTWRNYWILFLSYIWTHPFIDNIARIQRNLINNVVFLHLILRQVYENSLVGRNEYRVRDGIFPNSVYIKSLIYQWRLLDIFINNFACLILGKCHSVIVVLNSHSWDERHLLIHRINLSLIWKVKNLIHIIVS